MAELRRRLKESDELLLATDEDREGEAIAYHLVEAEAAVRRMVFHEITREAIVRALEETREIDRNLVDAQETRRILDRLYGYEVSPVLWKKVTRGLSAGRVQSVATRLVVERERAHALRLGVLLGRSRHARAGSSRPGWPGSQAGGSPRGATSARRASRARRRRPRRGSGTRLAHELAGRPFTVTSVEETPYSRRPAAPFRTSTLQQEASRKLRFPRRRRCGSRSGCMRTATSRTCGPTRSHCPTRPSARPARRRPRSTAPKPCPSRPRSYARAVANAQEAHEAIRPAGDRFRTPDQVRELARDEWALYELIWKRTIASQMKDAAGSTVRIRLGAEAAGEEVEFRAGTVITFPGFLLAYESARTSRPTKTSSAGCRRSTWASEWSGDARAAGTRDEPRPATPRRAW